MRRPLIYIYFTFIIIFILYTPSFAQERPTQADIYQYDRLLDEYVKAVTSFAELSPHYSAPADVLADMKWKSLDGHAFICRIQHSKEVRDLRRRHQDLSVRLRMGY